MEFKSFLFLTLTPDSRLEKKFYPLFAAAGKKVFIIVIVLRSVLAESWGVGVEMMIMTRIFHFLKKK
jgi:hypothetical protein